MRRWRGSSAAPRRQRDLGRKEILINAIRSYAFHGAVKNAELNGADRARNA